MYICVFTVFFLFTIYPICWARFQPLTGDGVRLEKKCNNWNLAENCVPDSKEPPEKTSTTNNNSCTYKNQTIPLNEYFNDGCEKLCFCTETELICRDKKCPLDDNLQNIDPECVSWQKLPVDFVPNYPNCCQHDAVCVSNGSCVYEERTLIENWAELGDNLSGCERKCYCELSRFECHDSCQLLQLTKSGVPALANDDDNDDDDNGDHSGKNLIPFECDANRIISVRKSDGDSCCIEWTCVDRQELEESLRITFVGDEFIEFKGLLPDGVLRLKGNVKVSVSVSSESTLVKSPGQQQQQQQQEYPMEQTIWQNSVFLMQKIATKLENLVADREQQVDFKIELINYNRTLNWTRLQFRTNPKSVQYASGLRTLTISSHSVHIGWRSLTDYDLQLFAGVRLEFKQITSVAASGNEDEDENENEDDRTGPFLETSLFVNDNDNSYRLRNLNANQTYLIRLVLVSGTGHESIIARDYLRVRTSVETHQNTDETILEHHNWAIRLLMFLLLVAMVVAVVYVVRRRKRKYKAQISGTTTMSSLTIFSK